MLLSIRKPLEQRYADRPPTPAEHTNELVIGFVKGVVNIWIIVALGFAAVYVLGSALMFIGGVEVTCAHDVGTPGTSEYRQTYATYTVRGFDALNDPEESIQARYGYYDVFDSSVSSGVECYES